MSGQPIDTISPLSAIGDDRVPARLGVDGRYALGRQIGRGGFGTVFAARDTQYDCDVAVKILRRADADALYRFKGEFRSVANISHANLVRLFELGVDDACWFVVMELIDGVDLVRFVSEDDEIIESGAREVVDTAPRGSLIFTETPRSRRFDRERLIRAFTGLAHGLRAIHEAGKLHRDLKPSNVLVQKDERVVILDFGLLLEAHERPGLLTGRGIGTPGYMAPEQIGSGALTPAADWYAFGAMLHEVLTGSVPRLAISDALPNDDLGTLCRALLSRDPKARPGEAEVLAALDPKGERPPASASSTVVGREAELRALDESFALATEGPFVVRIVGASGLGKSTLVDEWLARLRRRASPVVLRGRCLEHENVPFKAIDGVIDALAAHLAEAADDDPPSVRPATRMFPVLARPSDAADEEEGGDPLARREEALTCLRNVFTHIAERRGLIICIDDAQWADVEGMRALADLVAPRAAGTFLVLAQRPDAEISPVLDEWLAIAGIPERKVDLSLLDEGDALMLARSRVGEELAARVVREAAGNPFLLHQLADYHQTGSSSEAPIDIADLVSNKLDLLGASGRRLVEVVALAATPLEQRVLIDAAELEGPDARSAMKAAEQDRLVAGTRVAGASVLTTLHDRVREEVVRQIDPALLQRLHRRIAKALTTHGFDAPEVLLHHHLRAEDHDAATDAAVRAAEHAENVLAFERAAEHYATILRLGRRDADESELHEKRGNALANAGRSGEAAEALQAAARAFGPSSTDEDARALRALNRRSGELWLRSGHVDAGKTMLSECLAQVGLSMPKSAGSAMLHSARRRLWLFVRGVSFAARDEAEIPASELERLDVMWGVTTSLAMLEYLVADSIGLRHLLEALRAGEKKRVLRSLSFEVSLEAMIGGAFLEKHSAKLIEQMERLASEIDEPYFRAWTLLSRGVVAWADGSFAHSWKYCHEAAMILRRDTRGSTWELAVSDVYGLSSLSYVGDIPTLERIVPDAHRNARERGDRYATANLAFFESFVELAHDNPLRARELVERALEPFPKSKYLSIHYGLAYAIAQSHLYEDDAESAWRLIESDFPSWKKGGMLGVRTARIEIRYLRARAALAMLARDADHADAKRRLAEDLKHLEREKSSFGRAIVDAVHAGRAYLDGKHDEAVSRLERAAAGFEGSDMLLHASTARRHLERIRGADLVTILPNVADPERMSHLLLAGFRR